ncbi:DUF3501 family protein [Thiolinea disciformis]|uniref:DUF3501 family protein n=1 Tax=Thiolinea disciformis TaxID=125614 RepID=UPI000362A3EE|nr:DUF3501 family protein [Thiolinea disciformis]
MAALTRADLMSLEQYAMERAAFRTKMIAHKANRQVRLGEHASLYFEDRLTIQYQIQEMLRAEKIFEVAGIQAELDAYNPLIPDGSNWKATFMLEFPNPEERKFQLAQLIGIERATWLQVSDFEKVHPIANEDLPRETEEKTAAVHFLRFELTKAMIEALKQGASLMMGISHPNYTVQLTVAEPVRRSLVGDLA